MICPFKKIYQISDSGSEVPPPSECYEFTLISNSAEDIIFTYKPCGLPETTITLNEEVDILCAEYVNTPPYPSDKWSITMGGPCV